MVSVEGSLRIEMKNLKMRMMKSCLKRPMSRRIGFAED